MIRKIIAAFLMMSCCVFAGESTQEREFVVKGKMEVVSKWLKDHPKEVASATGSEFISRNGNKIRVKQDTPDGLFDFTSVETYKESATVHEYNSKLSQVHTGTLDDQTTSIKLESVGNGTRVTITLFASLPDRKGIVIKPRLHRSVKGFQELLERKFR